MKPQRFYALFILVLALLACQNVCTPKTVDGTLVITGNIDGCDYYTYTTNNNQNINVIVTGKYGYQWTQTFNPKTSSNTYTIGVPEKYAYDVQVIVEENDFMFTNNADCKQCGLLSCGNGNTGKPRWEGKENLGAGTTSVTVPVALPETNDKYCRCS